MKIGSVVLATAGKEKGQKFIVVRIVDGFAFLADGKRLSAFKPKKKSFKHLVVIEEDGLAQEQALDQNQRVNATIRKYLKKE